MPQAPAATTTPTKGEQFAADVRAEFDPSLADDVLLDRVAAVIDRIQTLQAALDEHGVVVTGSRNQPRASGLLLEIREAEGLLARLIKQLDMSEDDKPTRSRGGYTYAQRRVRDVDRAT